MHNIILFTWGSMNVIVMVRELARIWQQEKEGGERDSVKERREKDE